MIIFFIWALTTEAFSQHAPQIPSEIRPLMGFMAVTTGVAKNFSMAQATGEECEETKFEEPKPIIFPMKTKDSKWSFSVTTSLTTPPGKFEKKHQTQGYYLKRGLDSIIQTKYNSHEEREKAISEMCKGRSEFDRIQIASHLGSYLNSIYDDNRSSTAKVKPQDQWEALYNRSQGEDSYAGVCRDATLTLTQFLVACGFDKKQLGIQSYQTGDSGHQVVTIRDSQGQTYTINWSELYATDEKGGVATDLNPTNINTGLEYYTFDADGKLVAYRKTELGNIIKAVSGGTINDPDYLPHVLRLEANYGKFSGSLFKAETTSGDNATGVAASYKKTSPDELYVLSFGTSYVRNSKEVTSSKKTYKLDQSILYFQVESGIQPKFEVYHKGDAKIIIRPSGLMASEVYLTSNKLSYEDHMIHDLNGNVTGKVGLEAEFKKGNYSGWAGISSDLAVNKIGSTELISSDRIGMTLNEKKMQVGGAYDGEKYYFSTEGKTSFSYFENSYSIAATVADKDRHASGTVMYKVYERGQGWREDYIMVNGEKNFSLERVGKVAIGAQAQIPIGSETNDPTYFGTIRFNHK